MGVRRVVGKAIVSFNRRHRALTIQIIERSFLDAIMRCWSKRVVLFLDLGIILAIAGQNGKKKITVGFSHQVLKSLSDTWKMKKIIIDTRVVNISLLGLTS